MINAGAAVKRAILMAVILASCVASGQEATCSGDDRATICRFENGDQIRSWVDSNGTYHSERRTLDSRSRQMDLGSKETWDKIISREDPDEKKARHELCRSGVIKGYRCHDVEGIVLATVPATLADDHHDCFMQASTAPDMQRCNEDASYRKAMAEKYRALHATVAHEEELKSNKGPANGKSDSCKDSTTSACPKAK